MTSLTSSTVTNIRLQNQIIKECTIELKVIGTCFIDLLKTSLKSMAPTVNHITMIPPLKKSSKANKSSTISLGIILKKESLGMRKHKKSHEKGRISMTPNTN